MPSRVYRIICSVLLLALVHLKGAGNYTPTIADPILEPWRWQFEEAVEELSAVCMDEAPDKSLWFGNVGSIARYDGVELTVYPFDEALLSQIKRRKTVPWAKALKVMPDGRVLALVGSSLVTLESGKWTVIVRDIGPSVFNARLDVAVDGSIWVFVPEALWRISADLTEHDQVLAAPKGSVIGDFSLDESGGLWFVEELKSGTVNLVHVPDAPSSYARPEVWVRYSMPFAYEANEMFLRTGQAGRIWYVDSSPRSSIHVFDPSEERWETVEGADARPYYSLFAGRDGSLWAGGEQNIVRITSGGTLRDYPESQLALPRVPLSFYETSDTRLWVMGRIGYVYSVDVGTDEWMTYEGLNYAFETESGEQWFRGDRRRGVIRHDPSTGEWTRYDSVDGVIDTVHGLIESSHGLIWAFGQHYGSSALSVFDGEGWTLYEHRDFGVWIESNAALEASDGTLWFGSGGGRVTEERGGGALRYGVDANGKPVLLEHYTKDRFPFYVTSLEEGADGSIWIGSTGLYRYDPNEDKVHRVATLKGLNSMDLAIGQDGSLWVAREHSGVYRFLADVWTAYTVQDGLAGVSASNLLMMGSGALLAATEGGVSRFDGSVWRDSNYTKWMGMVRRSSGLFETAAGELWFNFDINEIRFPQLALNQVDDFRTIRHLPESEPPETSIVAYLDRVAQPGNTHVSWTASDRRSATPKAALQYSWRLNDGEWSSFSQATSHTFLDLPFGKYSLEVRARDQAFNIDPTPARIEFVVVAPIWRQPWFIVLLSSFSTLVALLLWVIVRNRERYLLAGQRDRENYLRDLDRAKTGFFSNISHELNTPLTLIIEPLKRVLKTEEDTKKRERISMALRNANRVLNLVGQLLDLQKLEMGGTRFEMIERDYVEFLESVVQDIQPMAQMHQVELSMKAAESFRGLLDEDKLRKIVQNLLSNAIKYTPEGGQVTLGIESGEDADGEPCATIVVEDTGLGIDSEHLKFVFDRYYRVPEQSIVDGSGIGLNLAKELVDLWGGHIEVESPIHTDEARPGTRFTVRLPVQKEPSQSDNKPLDSTQYDG